MPLTAGEKLGPYEIVSALGAGGMGEVYRARDTRLGRDVAIKISAAQFTERFEREARAVAALNHPNICHLYDVGPNYLVMELVEGATLATPLPLETALQYARQIAEALEAAHEKGIIHRDLKPANIKITPDGVVKVLDFGLAKAVEEEPRSGSIQDSPTMTLSASRTGMILGTAAYMSPEQATGKPVDKRADIWAFGVVLWEMLTGSNLFAGETVVHTLADVLRADIDFAKLPVTTPAPVRELLHRCLDRDVKTRLRDIGEARVAIQRYLSNPAIAAPTAAAAPRPARRAWIPWGFAAGATLALASLAFVHFREKAPAAERVRFQITPPANVNFSSFPVLSPDGRQLAFPAADAQAKSTLWVHSLDSGESRPLPEAVTTNSPLWSPDGRYLAFPADGKLKKIEVSGGHPETICAFNPGGGWGSGAWSQEGVIIFGWQILWTVPATGGDPVPLTALDRSRGELQHGRPRFLPDGRHFLYHRHSSIAENEGVYLGSLDQQPAQQSVKRLVASPTGPSYAPSNDPNVGYVLFQREDAILAQPFDTRRLELSGAAVTVARGAGETGSASPPFSVSSNGILAYSGGVTGTRQLLWYDRQGKILGPAGEPGALMAFRLSRDGNRIAARYSAAAAPTASSVRNGGPATELWLLDPGRQKRSRLTFERISPGSPVWSPDGQQIAVASVEENSYRWRQLYRKQVNDTGGEELLLDAAEPIVPCDWSLDGRFLLYASNSPKTDWDLRVLKIPQRAGESATTVPFAATQERESCGQFSPDSRWIVYSSTQGTRPEVFAKQFPADGAAPIPISTNGGRGPGWVRNGKEILYVGLDNRLMSVGVSTGPRFSADTPKPLFQVPISGPFSAGLYPGRFWDATGDGQKFLIAGPATAVNSAPITVVLNWPAALKK